MFSVLFRHVVLLELSGENLNSEFLVEDFKWSRQFLFTPMRKSLPMHYAVILWLYQSETGLSFYSVERRVFILLRRPLSRISTMYLAKPGSGLLYEIAWRTFDRWSPGRLSSVISCVV